jgi:hypothetical protein
MFKRRTKETRFSEEQTRRWLSWLASRMVAQGQTRFQIEDIRSYWAGQDRLRLIAVGAVVVLVTFLSVEVAILVLVVVLPERLDSHGQIVTPAGKISPPARPPESALRIEVSQRLRKRDCGWCDLLIVICGPILREANGEMLLGARPCN